ncbi:hypothetical protein SAY87_004970 [Trapa incisa]|uniref:RING-type E3 ubiquitin transferase n=1 Tax=Trapa incisa TaxID=236973 RepID=A0AAN7PNZ4_9MYRT|nr:hypothetical protein SAY87_004970 [Trapa incisa]
MSGSWEQGYDHGSQSDGSYHSERFHPEPIYDAFVCYLTKQIMHDPVTLENGQTFEREAIEKWFKECRDSGRRLVCPRTMKELRSADLNPSIALRNAIEEWTARNDSVQLEKAQKSLNLGSAEGDAVQALEYIQCICINSRLNKHIMRYNTELLPMIIGMLKSSSRRVPCKALETLRILAEEGDYVKEIMAEGDNVRTIVKFLSNEQSKERKEAVSLLYELSKSEFLSEKIGSVNGAILILVGMSSSKSENVLTVETAEKTLRNLETHENNVLQMAENGRLQPLLTQILEGPSETKLSMASYLGELMLSNDVKDVVARSVGSSLISLMKSSNIKSREASLKALNQIACETSANILIESGILPPLVKDLFTVGANQLPMRLKEVAATILANIVNCEIDFDSIPVGPDHQTLVSEDIIHSLLHLISNTGPAIECKLIQVLVGLTNSPSTAASIVHAIRSSGATISLVQFIEAPQRDLRLASIKLLQNLSHHMDHELADALRGSVGQLGSLIKVATENIGITEEQAAAAELLAGLPERDLDLTRQMLDEGAFQQIISRVYQIRQGEARGIRFMTPYLVGLVRILARVTYILQEDPACINLCIQNNLAALFVDLLQFNGLGVVQMIAALALENLSQETKNLTRLPELPPPGFCASIFPCFSKQPVLMGLCRLHHGACSLKDTFCLVEGQAVENLVALLDHMDERVVEAALAAICTLLEDSPDVEQGVAILCEAEGIKPILDILLEKKNDNLLRRSVWAVERLLRIDNIAIQVSGDPNMGTALVNAFQHGDYRTRQVAEQALKHVDKIPNFSGIFPNKV